MKKVNALVIGIVFLLAALAPFTSAFADSDPGLSSQVWSNTFGWYTGFPMVDSYGYMDINDWSITYRSNGQDASTPGAGDVVYLYQPGDYVEYSFNGYDLLSNYHSSLWGIQFGQNPSYGSGGLDDLKYILKQGYNSSDAFYQYIRGFQYDNREIDWAHIIFSYPGTGITTIRIEYDGTPAIWNCIYIKFNGWRNSPVDSSLTTADMLTLQNNIISAFNVARLADIIELDSSDVDLSTLEATTASILQKLANVPDIFNLLSHIDTTDTSILSAIQSFTNYFQSLYSYTTGVIALDTSKIINNRYSTQYNISTAADTTYGLYDFTISCHFYNAKSDIMLFRFYLTGWSSNCYITEVDFYFVTPNNTRINTTYIYFNSNDYLTFIFDTSNYLLGSNTSDVYIVANIKTSSSIGVHSNSQYYQLLKYDIDTNIGFFNAVILYLKNLVNGSGTQVPSGIQQTTDTVTDQVTDIVEFEDTYNTSLENSASQIDVSSYEIQQTQGMSFMRTYTELNFDRLQNFRILFLTPLILALAAFFLRRKT